MNNENELIGNIEFYYKKSLLVLRDFGGPSIYFHIQSIREQRANFLSERHCEMIYATLASWGMHKMGDPNFTKAKMVEYDDFKNSLFGQREELHAFNNKRFDESTIDEYRNYINELEKIYLALKVSISASTIVAHSKVLAHLLPDLVPPVDRQYTIRFFTQDDKLFFSRTGKYKNVEMPDSSNHFSAFVDYCVRIKRMYDKCNNSIFHIDSNTFNTSIPKIMDNIIMSFVKNVPKP
jgi:hypothetical protein